MFSIYHQPIANTNYINHLIKDYIQGKLPIELLPEYQYNLEHFKSHIASKSKHKQDRGNIVNILNNQNKLYLQNTNIQYNISLLKDDNTFCITTAHQLNIFTGPLYVIYKIVTSIRISEALKELFPEYNFVPVYVMGTEDHDLEEIRHFHIYNKTLSWETLQQGACGRMNTDGIAELIEALQNILQKNGDEINALLSHAYSHYSLSEAQRYLIYHIFLDKNLLIADGDDIDFKAMFIPFFKDEILNASAETFVHQQNDILKKYNYPIQSHVRPINIFYMKDDIRERIILEQDTYKINNTQISFSKVELLEEIDSHPENFSPNVILRPLYQQVILPSICYVGGGGELSYWLQLVPLFSHYRLPFPKLVLRNSALFFPSYILKKWHKTGLKVLDVFSDFNTLKNNYISKQYDLKNIEKELDIYNENLYTSLVEHIQNIDPGLTGWIKAEQQKFIKQNEAIVQRLNKSLQQKNSTQLHQIENILATLFPNQQPQERHESMLWLWHLYGKSEVLDTLFKNFKPLANDITVFAEE